MSLYCVGFNSYLTCYLTEIWLFGALRKKCLHVSVPLFSSDSDQNVIFDAEDRGGVGTQSLLNSETGNSEEMSK